ncbi:MAG: hypothetical protein KC940_04340, partial [Candidatus Omnitrophica bacterium]|nr:hypothetical protein [Candidatus Omnitrophota bacterium]
MNPSAQPFEPSLNTTSVKSPPFLPGKDLARRLIQGNVFYIFSAFLMMLGCFRLMPSSSIEAAEQFSRRLQSLLILEGYQLLVIATAVVIVRKLKILSDAATLLLVAVTLLLDPTFFSNAFLTLKETEGPGVMLVNAACLLLVPIKLAILQWGLRIRFTQRAFLTMVYAGILVYFGAVVLNFDPVPIDETIFYYTLGWATFAMVLILPWYGRVLSESTYRSNHVSQDQKYWIPRLIAAIPVLITAFHYLETSSVYEIKFYPVYLTPLLLAVGVFVLRMVRPTAAPLPRCLALDMVGAMELLFALPDVTTSSVAVKLDRQLIPEWLMTPIPLGITGVVLIGAYVFCARKYSYRPALYRIGLLAAAGLVYLSVQKGWAYNSARWTLTLVFDFPRTVIFLCSPFLLALAYRFREFWLWLAESLFFICFFFTFLPGELYHWIPEILQASFLASMVLYHHFPDPRNEKVTLAILLITFGLGRLLVDPSGWAAAIVLAETVGLFAAGYFLSVRGYIFTAILQLTTLLTYGGYRSQEYIHPGYLVLILGLTVFFLGTGVTFNKKQILRW